jgi:hypothetical protein
MLLFIVVEFERNGNTWLHPVLQRKRVLFRSEKPLDAEWSDCCVSIVLLVLEED